MYNSMYSESYMSAKKPNSMVSAKVKSYKNWGKGHLKYQPGGKIQFFKLLIWNSKTWLELGSNGYFLVLIDISNFIFHFHFLSGLTKSGTQKTRNKKLDFLRNYRKWKWKMKLEISISTKKYPFEPTSNHVLLFHFNS